MWHLSRGLKTLEILCKFVFCATLTAAAQQSRHNGCEWIFLGCTHPPTLHCVYSLMGGCMNQRETFFLGNFLELGNERGVQVN